MLSWEIVYGAGALVLALAIAWGFWRNATRNRENDEITEAATRAEYRDPAHYRQIRARFQRMLRPR